MPKHLYLLLGFTFFIGLLSGSYVYFVTRAPSDVPHFEERNESVYEIVVTVYGGCEMVGCPSLRVLDDGSYTFIDGSHDDASSRFEGKLSLQNHRLIRDQAHATPYEDILQSSATKACPVTYDGAAYRYAIQYAGEQYEFDSCVHDVEGEPLFEELIRQLRMIREAHQA